MRFALLALLAAGLQAGPLVVISVDGLDHRYLNQRDQLGLKIPNIRRLLKEGSWADGVIGVAPSITWPSHTSIVTGVPPDQHGILSNWRPHPGKPDLYLTADQIKTPTLWDAAKKRGLKTAAVDWPVTTGASIDFNLPEYFQRRSGGGMDLESIEKKSTPGLVDRIAKAVPSFGTQWMDDRTRTLATIYLLEHEHPDLLLLHLVDHDAEAHDTGPFSRESNAMLEYTDELIGAILKATPKNYTVALVSDHGFERVDKVLNLPALLIREGVHGEVQGMGGIATTKDEAVAVLLRKTFREIPAAEVERYAPKLAGSFVFEPPEHVEFGGGKLEELYSMPREKGNHGFWPTRKGYRSVFVLWGSGVKPGGIGELSMLEIAPRLAKTLDVAWP